MEPMTSIKKIIPGLIVISFMASGAFTSAMGQESLRFGDKSLCKSGDQQRSVQVQYYAEEKNVPCEVHYYKETEQPGMGQVLWRAANEVGFCEKKMAVFLNELSDSGWNCEQSADASSEDEVKSPRNEVLPPDLSSE
jgi:hypothetical protein